MSTSEARPAPIRKLIASLWSGFVTPAPISLAVLLASAVLVAVLACLVFTPALVAGREGKYLARRTDDNEDFATREALIDARAPPPRPGDPSWLYLVSDSALPTFLAQEKATAAALAQTTGRPWRVSFLTTGAQGPFDEAALADYATRHGPGVVVLSASYQRFGDSWTDLLKVYHRQALGIRSDWADQEMREMGLDPPLRVGVYAIDNANFTRLHFDLPFLARVLERRAVQRRTESFVIRTPRLLGIQRRLALNRLRHGIDYTGFGSRLLTETVHRIEARGSRVVFAEEPANPALIASEADRKLYRDYLARAEPYYRGLGAGYCRLADSYEPPASAYLDYVHLGDAGARARMQRALADCIASDTKARGTQQ